MIFYQPQAVSKEIFELVQKQNLNYFLIGGTKTNYEFLNQMNLGFKKQITNSTEDYFGELNSDFSPFQTQDLNFQDFPPLVDVFGEISISITLGKNTGVNNKIAGLTSMNVPDINMMTTNSSNMLVGFKPNVDIDSDN